MKEPDPPVGRLRTALLRTGKAGVRTLAGGVLLVLLFVGVLQSDVVSTWVMNQVAGRLNPYPGTRLTVDRASGSWIRSLRLEGVTLAPVRDGDPGGPRLALDTLTLRFRLLPLLVRKLDLRGASITGLEARLTQRPDSLWDFLLPFQAGGEPPQKEEGGSGFRVSSGPISLRSASARLTFAPGGPSEAPDRLEVEELTLLLAGLELGEDRLEVGLDTILARFLPPGEAFDRVSVAGKGSLVDGRLTVPGLVLRSGLSDASAEGTLLLPRGEEVEVDGIDFHLGASPLAFRDLSGFLRTLDPAASAEVDLRIRGRASRVEVSGGGTLSTGGSVELEGAFTPSGSGPAEYRLRADVAGLGLESLLGSGAVGGEINGMLAVGLEGRDRAHLSGDVSARVEGLLLDGRGIRPLEVSGALLDGVADLEVDGGADAWGEIRLSVGGRPLDPHPTLEVRGSFLQGPSPLGAAENLLDRAGFRELEAGFVLRTEGISMDSAAAEVEVETLGGSFRNLSLAGGALTASWSEGTGTFRLDQPVGSGRVATRGEVKWGGSPTNRGDAPPILAYSLTGLEVQDLELSRLLGDTLPSRVNAQGSVAGVGTEPGTLRASAEIRLRASTFRGLVLDSALVRPSLEAGAFSGFVDGWLGGSNGSSGLPAGEGGAPGEMEGIPETGVAPIEADALGGPAEGGRLLVSLSGRPFDDTPLLTLDSLVFSGVDLVSTAGLPTSLNGIVRARMEGLDPRTGNLSGEIRLSPSRIRDTSVETGEGMFSLSGGELQVSGEVRSPDGRIQVTADGNPFAEPASFRLEGGEVRGLNLGPFLGKEELRSELNLTLSLSGSGETLQDMETSGELLLLPSTLNQGRVQGGSITLNTREGRGTARGDIRTGAGEVTFQALASLSAGLEDVRIDGNLDLPDLAAFLDRGEEELEARGTVHATWTAGGRMDFASELRGRIGGAAVDSLDIRGSLQNALLRLDTLRVRSDLLGADGAGRLALEEGPGGGLESDLTVTATVLDLSPLGPFLDLGEMDARSGGGNLHLTGPAGAPAIAASLDLGPWRLKGLSGDSARVTVDSRGDDLVLTTWVREAGGEGTVDLALRADPRPEERRGVLHRLDISTSGTLWTLEDSVPFSWKDGPRIDGFVLSSGPGRISVDGRIDPRGTQDLLLTVEEAAVSGVARMLGREDLTLRVDGQIALTGPATSPRVEGDLRLGLALREGASTAIESRFSLVDGVLALGARARDEAGGELALEGSIPMAFSLAPEGDSASSAAGSPAPPSPEGGPVDLTIRSHAFDLSWAPAVLPAGALAAMEGILSADLRATGPLDQPVLEGRIGLSNGMIRLPGSGARYQKIDLSAELGDQEIRIDRASVTSGSGTAEIRGSVALQGLRAEQLDITARMDRFLAWSTPLVSATLTGDLSLTGSLDEPRVAGNLNLEGSKVGLDDVSAGSEVQAVELTEADYQMLEEYFGYTADRGKAEPARALERLGLDLALSFDRDVWVSRSRQPRITLEMRGELEIEKDPGEGFRVVGTVETLPERSYFRQFGRRFSVQEGEVTLTGDPAEFSFRMDARWEVPSYSNPDESEVVVNLEVVGDAGSLELTLSSEPEMDEADIVSYLATGKPQNALGSSETDAQGLGTSMAVGAMAGVLEGIASEAVELDVVEIKVDPVKGTTLIAGRYVSPDLYLGFRQPVTFSESNKRTRSENQSSEVEVEYRWFRWLTMNVQGGASELRLFLKARYAY